MGIIGRIVRTFYDPEAARERREAEERQRAELERAEREFGEHLDRSVRGLTDRALVAAGARNLRRLYPLVRRVAAESEDAGHFRFSMIHAEGTAGLSDLELPTVESGRGTLQVGFAARLGLVHVTVSQMALAYEMDDERVDPEMLKDSIRHSLDVCAMALRGGRVPPELVRAFFHDCDLLRHLAGAGELSDGTPITESMLGPLWPDGPPTGWDDGPQES